jgi:hypothetical protein
VKPVDIYVEAKLSVKVLLYVNGYCKYVCGSEYGITSDDPAKPFETRADEDDVK